MYKDDGGYYAIKGFLYQFDKSILEILNLDENSPIYVERIQDINYEKYVIQVKHKESVNFSNSIIREPIIQLLDLYLSDNTQKFILYAYFKDKSPNKKKFSNIDELHDVLKYRDQLKTDELRDRYTQVDKEGFIQNFTLHFAEDFEKQFECVIKKIKSYFNLRNDEEALVLHSLIRQKLFELSIEKEEYNRTITGKELKKYIEKCNKKIFYRYYDIFISRDRYLKLVKKEFFTNKSANLNNYERIFIIDCDESYNKTTIRKIIDNISSKYHKKHKSPAPYICFRGIKREELISVKQDMIDDNIKFSDGTYFDGDKFRLSNLKNIKFSTDICVKIIDEIYLEETIEEVTFKEYYHLFIDKPIELKTDFLQVSIQINELEEINKIIG